MNIPNTIERQLGHCVWSTVGRGELREVRQWQVVQGLEATIRTLDVDLGADGSHQRVSTRFCVSSQSQPSSPFAILLLHDYWSGVQF